MSSNKWVYEYTEYRVYKCLYCGRTMHEKVPHICNGNYRKNNLQFAQKDKED